MRALISGTDFATGEAKEGGCDPEASAWLSGMIFVIPLNELRLSKSVPVLIEPHKHMSRIGSQWSN